PRCRPGWPSRKRSPAPERVRPEGRTADVCGMMVQEKTALIDSIESWTRYLKMPLLDHFHPPVSERRRWEGFHGLWAAALVEKLNRDVLAEEYFADMHVHVGSQVEIDVATLEEPAGTDQRSGAGAPAWAPPPA